MSAPEVVGVAAGFPVGDPQCEIDDCRRWVGRVSHPADTGRASVYVCNLPSHQQDAVRWVEELTGTPGEFVAFRKAVPS